MTEDSEERDTELLEVGFSRFSFFLLSSCKLGPFSVQAAMGTKEINV